MINRIITRGMGSSATRIITRGYGGFFKEAIVAITQTTKKIVGKSGEKYRELEEQLVTVFAKLVDVNGNEPKIIIQGTIKIVISNTITKSKVIIEHVVTKVKDFYNDIKVYVNLVK